MPRLPFRSLSVVALALTGACTEIDDGDLEFRTTIGDDPIQCPKCTDNSPAINDFRFPELHLGGLPNSSGVELVGLVRFGIVHTLTTDIHEELVALDQYGAVRATGAQLIGWKLRLRRDGEIVEGTIVAHDDAVPGWNDLARANSTYAIAFTKPDDLAQQFNVCPTYFEDADAPVLTIIRGATYDREEKHVDLIDDDWVTFACADQAAYKAKLLGYEQAMPLGTSTQPATRAQQDATLKMITADYCGTGHSFTGQGIHMAWEDAADTVNMPPEDIGPLEAMWDDDGAICLNIPRKASLSEVAAVCPLPPPCELADLNLRPPVWTTWQPPPP